VPDAQIWMVRVGSPYVHRIGGAYIMKSIIAGLLMAFSFVGPPNQPGDAVAKAKAALTGNWVIVRATLCGEAVPLKEFERDGKPVKWTFSNTTFKAFVGGDASVYEEGSYDVFPGESPKHLDLVPTKGEILTTRKCLYSLQGDELKIAFSI